MNTTSPATTIVRLDDTDVPAVNASGMARLGHANRAAAVIVDQSDLFVLRRALRGEDDMIDSDAENRAAIAAAIDALLEATR